MCRKRFGVWITIIVLLCTVQTSWAVQSHRLAYGDDGLEAGARLFPASTAAFIQIPNLGQMIDEVINHPLREKLEQLDQVKSALNNTQMKQLRIGLAYIETQIGEQWLPALKKLTGGGLFIGLDPKTEGVGLAFRSTDEALLKETAGVIIGFIKNNGDAAIEIDEYRGGKVAEIENVVVARFGDWFLMSNKKQLAQQMADNLLDNKTGLAGNRTFKTARAAADLKRDAWAFVDLQQLRRMNVAEELFRGSTDEPGAELIFGGIIEALKAADTAAISLDLDASGVALRAELPFDASDFNPAREFFFGKNGQGRAPRPLSIPGQVAQLVTYRDLGSWWLSKEDLFPENVIAQLAQSDSELSTVFGGMDFGQEVLGALEPQMRIVVKRQEFKQDVKPDVELPAFALIGRMKNPEVERRFRIAFQSLIGFLNINAGQMDYPPFDLMTTRENGINLSGGEYVLDREVDKGLMVFNFSPAIAFQGDYIVISSSTPFAAELAEATKQLDAQSETSDTNTQISIDAATIQQLLEDNRQSLIAQSMVNSGKSRERATAEIDLILGLLDYVQGGSLDYRVEPQRMYLDARIDLRGN